MKTMKNLFTRVMLVALSLVTALGAFAAVSPITVYARDARLPAAFFAERRVNTYNRPGGTVNGFFDERTTGKRVEAWGFWANNREYWRVSFNLFAGGRATRYIRRDDLIRASGTIDVILARDTRVFERSNLARQAGTVWGGQRARDRGAGYTVALNRVGNAMMIVHRLDAGGGRIGWIHMNDFEGAVRRSDGAVWRNGQWTTQPPSNVHNVSLAVPRFSQTDSRWRNVMIGTRNINDRGCLLVSMAMLESLRLGRNVYPNEMRNLLSFAGPNGNCLVWSSATRRGTISTFSEGINITTQAGMQRVHNLLRAGRPVVIGAHRPGDSNNWHWVVITGYTRPNNVTNFRLQDFTINDPMNNRDRNLLEFNNRFPGRPQIAH